MGHIGMVLWYACRVLPKESLEDALLFFSFPRPFDRKCIPNAWDLLWIPLLLMRVESLWNECAHAVPQIYLRSSFPAPLLLTTDRINITDRQLQEDNLC